MPTYGDDDFGVPALDANTTSTTTLTTLAPNHDSGTASPFPATVIAIIVVFLCYVTTIGICYCRSAMKTESKATYEVMSIPVELHDIEAKDEYAAN